MIKYIKKYRKSGYNGTIQVIKYKHKGKRDFINPDNNIDDEINSPNCILSKIDPVTPIYQQSFHENLS